MTPRWEILWQQLFITHHSAEYPQCNTLLPYQLKEISGLSGP